MDDFIAAIDRIPEKKLVWVATKSRNHKTALVEVSDGKGNTYKIELIKDEHSVGYRRVDITFKNGKHAYLFVDTHSVQFESKGILNRGGFNRRFSPIITKEQYEAVLAAIKSIQ